MGYLIYLIFQGSQSPNDRLDANTLPSPNCPGDDTVAAEYLTDSILEEMLKIYDTNNSQVIQNCITRTIATI